MKSEATERDVRVEPGLDPPLDPLHVGVGGGQVLLGVENSRVTLIGMPAKIDSSIAVQPGLGAGDLDEEVVALGLGRAGRAACSIVASVSSASSGETSSEHAAVDAVGALVDGREQVGGAAQVGERELEEELLGRSPTFGASSAICSS